jgi:hypothetical protein
MAFAKTVADPTWRSQLIATAARWRELADRASEFRGLEHQPKQDSGSKNRLH